MDQTNHHLSIVIPLWNEENNVPVLLQEIGTVFSHRQEGWELIAVDDSSNDKTYETLIKFSKQYPWLQPIRLSNHQGQSAALLTGFKIAKYPIIVTMDADMQTNPKDIFHLVEKLRPRSLVHGIRRKRKDGWLKKISSRIANSIRHRILQDGISDAGCPLKVFWRDDLSIIPEFNGIHRFIGTFFQIAGYEIIQMEIEHRPRRYGQSKYGLLDRLIVTIPDLLGVYWLMKRRLNLKIEER